MQSLFSNALSWAVARHILSATRRETLSWLTLLIYATRNDQPLAAGGLYGKRGADGVGAAAVYWSFQFVQLDGAHAARVLVERLGLSGKPWVRVIDRANWDFGKTTINILMISVTWNGMGIPLL